MPILITEDHVDNLELMNYLLRAFGYATLAATDGITGLDMALREDPDLILCDIHLPGIDGLELARRLKQDARLRPVPLVAITALAMVGGRERVLGAGFDGYLPKPINPETFVSSIETFLKPDDRRQPDRRLATTREPEAERAVMTPAPIRGTILVVDNVPANLELAQSIFEPSGFRVMLAGNLSSAMALAKQTRPDVVLSDVNMPEGSGFELARRIKSDPQLQTVPVVLISATLPPDITAEEALAMGANKFVRRPIDPMALLEEIEDCLKTARRAAG
jgi:two-component system cell cycle response regulator